MEHVSIFFMCLLMENGSATLNCPCLFVCTSLRNNVGFDFEFGSLHSIATNAPERERIDVLLQYVTVK